MSFVTATDVVYVKFTREMLAGIISKDRAIRSAVLAVLGIRVSELWLRSLDRKAIDSEVRKPMSLSVEMKLGCNRTSKVHQNDRTLEVKPPNDSQPVTPVTFLRRLDVGDDWSSDRAGLEVRSEV